MKVALVVNKVSKSIINNFSNIITYINRAADENADMVLFSETAITGLINNDNPKHDIDLGITEKGHVVCTLCELARKRNINIAIGIFEKNNQDLYDSAVFINRSGEIGLKYRRITDGWHDPRIKDSIYREGNEIKTYKSDIGEVCFLICGDLFEDNLVNEVKQSKVDYLLFPFARSFYDGSANQNRWENEELELYINQIKKTNTMTFGVNYLGEEYFGGAFIVSQDGRVLSSLKLGQEGMLIHEI